MYMSLKNDLKNFGLNPAEWTIRKLSGQRYKIAAIADSSFFFLGETRNEELPQWKELKLASI